MRITSISLTDFRAFPGPDPTMFQLEGKNLLVCGENGSGKSSLFYAFREFFRAEAFYPIAPFKNKFTLSNGGDCAVKVAFSDGTVATWSGFLRTVVPDSKRSDVTGAALRSASLDYRSILDTNYLHNFDSKPFLTAAEVRNTVRPVRKINLFKAAVDTLLGGFLVTSPGGGAVTQTTIRALWQEVERKTSEIGETANATSPNVLNALVAFKTGLDTALTQLNPFLQPLIDELGYPDLRVNLLTFGGLTPVYSRQRNKRYFDGQTLWLDVEFRGVRPDEPQNFLNEARLSALGLAIYLAGRLALVQGTPQDALKLLVLDDVLIGLDQSNRIPVLDMLEKHFKDWQIVLLTHDRLWFETARVRADLSGNWNVVELYASNEPDTYYRPIPVPGNTSVVEEYLRRATDHLSTSDWRAAAVYVRSAFEMWLKIQCAKHSVPIRYHLEPRRVDSNDYFNALEGWAERSNAKPAFGGLLNLLALYRDTVFNPGSHSYPTSMSGGELRAAIKAMRFVNESTKFGKNAMSIATGLISKTNAAPEDFALAAGYLRVAFLERLRELSRGKLLPLPFSMVPHKIKPADLWTAMAANWPAKRAPWVNGINANRAILLDDWTWLTLLTLTAPQLKSALIAMRQH